jgi:hypothetical protein
MTASGDAGARTHARTRVRGVKSLMYSKGVRCPVCDAHLDLGATVRLRGRQKEFSDVHYGSIEQEAPATAEDDSDG